MPPGVEPPVLLSTDEVWNRVDPFGPDLPTVATAESTEGLPYAALQGAGFERLCFELLVAAGSSPRFFGRSGEEDFGVDIVDEGDSHRTVYQCKNLAQTPSWEQIAKAVSKFEREWLHEAGLPSVHRFVFCCPQRIDQKRLATAWTRFKDDFQHRTGVEISFWDRHYIDARLRRLPDIVAGLFSPFHAERFCSQVGWPEDPWIRVKRGELRHASLARFIDRHDRGAIQLPQAATEVFADLLSRSAVMAIRGLPGAGKTFLGLELASRARDPVLRIYYATLGSSTDPERLWVSVRKRASLPAVFILDDCHLDVNGTGLVVERLSPELSDPASPVKLLLILRDIPVAPGQMDDSPEWLRQLVHEEKVIDCETGLERTRSVAVHLQPDLEGLPKSRLEHLYNLTGGDLFLLDEAISAAKSPQDLGTASPEYLYASLRKRYFGGNRRLPSIQALACLAQFELVPRADYFMGKWLPGERECLAPLMTELFAPSRYLFLHSSLAEVVARALLSLEHGESSEEDVLSAAIVATRGYLRYLLNEGKDNRAAVSPFVATLRTVVHGRLRLAGGRGDARVKAAIVGDEEVRAGVATDLVDCPFTLLNQCLGVLPASARIERSFYVSLVVKRFAILRRRREIDAIGVGSIGAGFAALARHAPGSLGAIEERIGSDAWFDVIAHYGGVAEVFSVLRYATPAFRVRLLDWLRKDGSEAWIETAIASGRSVRKLHLAMRALGTDAPEVLGSLEAAIGEQAFLRIICAGGTLIDVFNILQFATPSFRERLLLEIESAGLEGLLERAMRSGRRIGMLSLGMRLLARRDPVLLDRIERAIGANAFVRLVSGNGTMYDVFGLLQYASPSFRMELLDELSKVDVESLVNRSTKLVRSIAPLSLTASNLRKSDPELLERVENILGPTAFLQLVTANGTLLNLMNVLRQVSPSFRRAMLEELSEEATLRLVGKTIGSGKSIGALDFEIRELARDDDTFIARLEGLIGVSQFWRLIVANGSIIELFSVLRYMTAGFGRAVVERLRSDDVRVLVARTVRSQRSVGTLELAIRHLHEGNRPLLMQLERVIGVEAFLYFMCANGTLVELFGVMNNVSGSFRRALLGAMDETMVHSLVEKTIAQVRPVDSLHYLVRQVSRDRDCPVSLEALIGRRVWWHLMLEVGNLSSLLSIWEAMGLPFRLSFLEDAKLVSCRQWSSIIARSQFCKVCEFVRDGLRQLPSSSKAVFRDALEETAAPLALSATWSDLNSSRLPNDGESAAAGILKAALWSRITRLQVEDLHGLDLREAVNGLAFAWRERPELRGALRDRLWEILPDVADWPRREGEIGVLRLALTLARSEEIPFRDARRLLVSVVETLDGDVCSGMHTLPLFLLIWNVAALHYRVESSPEFATVLSDPLLGVLRGVLRERVRRRSGNREVLAQFALGGLLGLFAPALAGEVHEALASIPSVGGDVRMMALEQTFVPAFFALEGLALTSGSEGVFTDRVCEALLRKSAEYDEVGLAIEDLRERLRLRVRRSSG